MSPELSAALDALPAAVGAACSERLRKIEAALEWAAEHPDTFVRSVLMQPGPPSGTELSDALIALHERAGK